MTHQRAHPRGRKAIWAVFLLLLTAQPAWSEPSLEEMLRKARDLTGDGQFQNAITLLKRIVQDPATPPPLQGAAHIQIGLCQMALGQAQQAETSFAEALKSHPLAAIDPSLASPTIQRAFEGARQRIMGRLRVTANRGEAQIMIDGQRAGVAPLELALPVGRHRLGAETGDQGHRAETVEVLVSHDTTTAHAMELKELPGSVLIESVPPGAQALVNGELLGVTPLALEGLPSGRRSIELTREGFQRVGAVIEVKAGQRTKLSLLMVPQAAPPRDHGPSPLVTWGWITGGTGLAAASAGAILLGLALSQDGCTAYGERCAVPLYPHEAQTVVAEHKAGLGLLVTGGVALTASLIMLIVGYQGPEESPDPLSAWRLP